MIYQFEYEAAVGEYDSQKLTLDYKENRLQFEKKTAVNPCRLYYKFSDDCNIHCVYCFQKNDRDHFSTVNQQNEELSKSFNNNLLSSIIGSQIYDHILYGGEPLLESNIEAIKRLFALNENTYSIFTNGCWTSKIVNFIKQNMHKINMVIITLDGAEKVHNSRRKMVSQNGFKIIMDNLKAFKGTDLNISLQINVDVENIQESSDLLHFLLDNDIIDAECTMITLNPVLHTGKALNNIRFLQASKDLIDNHPELTIYPNSKVLKNLASILYGEGICYSRCQAGIDKVIDFKRSIIYTCPQSIDTKIGEIQDDKVYLDSQKITQIQKYNEKKTNSCISCEYRFYCRYGCIVDDDLGRFHPDCKKETHETLQFLFNNFMSFFDIVLE